MFGMNLLGEKDYPTLCVMVTGAQGSVLGGRQSDNAVHKKPAR